MCPGLPMRWLSQTLRCSGQPRPAMAIAAKIDQNPTKIDPRSTQNRPKIDPKSTQIGQKSSLDGSRRPFGLQGGSGSRLDPENPIRWTPLGPPSWEPKSTKNRSKIDPQIIPTTQQPKSQKCQKHTCFCMVFATSAILCWGQKSTKIHQKSIQKRLSNPCSKLGRFKSQLGCILGGFWAPRWGQVGTKSR